MEVSPLRRLTLPHPWLIPEEPIPQFTFSPRETVLTAPVEPQILTQRKQTAITQGLLHKMGTDMQRVLFPHLSIIDVVHLYGTSICKQNACIAKFVQEKFRIWSQNYGYRGCDSLPRQMSYLGRLFRGMCVVSNYVSQNYSQVILNGSRLDVEATYRKKREDIGLHRLPLPDPDPSLLECEPTPLRALKYNTEPEMPAPPGTLHLPPGQQQRVILSYLSNREVLHLYETGICRQDFSLSVAVQERLCLWALEYGYRGPWSAAKSMSYMKRSFKSMSMVMSKVIYAYDSSILKAHTPIMRHGQYISMEATFEEIKARKASGLELAREGTVLHCMASLGETHSEKYYSLRLLLDSVNKDKESTLHFAARKGDTKMVQWCIEVFTTPGASRDQYVKFALDIAIEEEHKETVAYLVRQFSGKNINDLNKHGYSVLHTACEEGYTEIVQALLEAPFIDVDRKAASLAWSKCSALKIAIHLRHMQIIRTLMAAGASIGPCTWKEARISSPLATAIKSEQWDIVQCVVQYSPLHLNLALLVVITGDCSEAKLPSMIKKMVEAGADVNYRDKHSQKTPLTSAARRSLSPDIIKYLLGAGADPNMRDGNQRTALDYARSYENHAAIQILEPVTAAARLHN